MIYNDIFYSTVSFDKFQIDPRELCAHLGGDLHISALQEYIDKYNNVAVYKYAYASVNISIDENNCSFDFTSVNSSSLSAVLKGSREAIIMAVSAGIDVDRLISRAHIQSEADAFIFDAIASAGIESFANYITKQINEKYVITNRFSPGYADLPLEFQEELLSRLNASKTVGISLTQDLLMIPTKSITAIMGIKSLKGCTDEQNL